MIKPHEIPIGRLGARAFSKCVRLGFLEDGLFDYSITAKGIDFIYKSGVSVCVYPNRVNALKVILLTVE